MKTRAQIIIRILLVAALVFSTLAFSNNSKVDASTAISLSGTCHVQDYGDTDGVWDAATGILTLGTRGQAKRVEAITINLENNTGYLGTLQYRVHVQDIGWQEYRNAGEMAGTSGQAKRLEGIEMNLTGDLAAYYTVEYAVHIQDYGDAQGFVSDGALAGTTGESKRLEEVQVRIVPRWQGTSTSVNYRVHRQDYGWESTWAKDGAESGTVGQSKRLEGIEIHLTGNQYSGGIEYRTHVQNIGWETTWSKNGEMSGTQGLSYRLEGIEIKLTGQISNYYDVYYRVHAQDYGWLGWAKNGEMSGTSGMSKRLEAIQIVLVAKGGAAPGNVAGVTSVMNEPAVIDGVPTNPSGNQLSVTSQPQPSASSTSTAPSGDGGTATESDPNAEPVLDYTVEIWAIKPFYLDKYDYNGYTADQLLAQFDGTTYAKKVIDADGTVISDNSEAMKKAACEDNLGWMNEIVGCDAGMERIDTVTWLYSTEYYYTDGSVKKPELDYYVVYFLAEANWFLGHDYNGYTRDELWNMTTILGISTTIIDADGTVIYTDRDEVVDDVCDRAADFLRSIDYPYPETGFSYWGYAVATDYYYEDGSVMSMADSYDRSDGQVFFADNYVYNLIKNAQQE